MGRQAAKGRGLVREQPPPTISSPSRDFRGPKMVASRFLNEQEIVLTYSQPTTEQHKLQGPIGGKRKPNLCDTRIIGRTLLKRVFCFFLPFVRNRVVLFCGLVAERQYNPPSSSSSGGEDQADRRTPDTAPPSRSVVRFSDDARRLAGTCTAESSSTPSRRRP